ncbi:unnamed protein product [Vicia faba]|uniref:Pentatricopeptide repeat-containing protein n=1 Tax=Vicia faba TaxID=3906 RepID=A0AAV1AX10_VICFA|nr:unnamed protein product [Vicia faba]
MMLNPRYAIPKFSPNPILTSSTLFLYRFFSHLQRHYGRKSSGFHNVDAAVTRFNCLIHALSPPPTCEFDKVLGAIVRMGHYPTAISLFSQFQQLRGISPSIATFSILINCFCHQSHMGFSFSLLGTILKSGYEPNMGICLMITVLQLAQLPNIKVATVLLSSAFAYDIFWVFISPLILHESVMIACGLSPVAEPASGQVGQLPRLRPTMLHHLAMEIFYSHLPTHHTVNRYTPQHHSCLSGFRSINYRLWC